MQLSNKVQKIPEALSIQINQLVYEQQRAGKDITVLSLGEAFFDIPMFDFNNLDFVKGYHYSDSQGIPELRRVIAQFYNDKYTTNIDPDKNLIITAGSKLAIFTVLKAILNEGDEVYIHEPAWLSYKEQILLVGGAPKFIDYDIPIENFNQYFSPKTKVLIINNPNNPSGRAYSYEELQSLHEQCSKLGIYILVDEAYSDFVIEDKFYSMANIAKDLHGVIIINSLSKNMGMSGWRVGYTIANNTLIKHLLKLNQHLITCAPTILQAYMAKYFNAITSITLPQVEEIVKKRQRIAECIDKIGLKRMQGNSTFYFLIDIENFQGSSLDFAVELLNNHQIAVVPGSAYGKSCSRFIRIGVGAESEERIYDAILVIKDLIHSKQTVKQTALEECSASA